MKLYSSIIIKILVTLFMLNCLLCFTKSGKKAFKSRSHYAESQPPRETPSKNTATAASQAQPPAPEPEPVQDQNNNPNSPSNSNDPWFSDPNDPSAYTAFPNRYEAPTMQEQLNSANFTAPLLSRALYELDPQKKVKLSEFLETIRFTMYNMTRGEAIQMFFFIDKNKDELVDQREYDDFAMLYVYPFEACDSNRDYLLDGEEFKLCFEKDPNSHFIRFRKSQEDDYWLKIMDSITTRSKEIINFEDYLIYRKAAFGWRECGSTSLFISKDAFACSIRTIFPIKYHMNFDINRFYDSGWKMCSDFNLIELDFICYTRTLYYSYVYITFSQTTDIPGLSKSDFLKAIRDDRIPQNFSEEDVQLIYKLQDNSPLKTSIYITPESWFFWFNIHRLFNKYSIERPMQLSESELTLLLKDHFLNEKIKHSIDRSLTGHSEAAYLEASLVLNKYRTNERSFFYKFKETGSTSYKKAKLKANKGKARLFNKQDISAVTASYYYKSKNHTYYDVPESDLMRHFFYTIPLSNTKYSWDRPIYFRVLHLCNFYTQFIRDATFLVPVTDFHEKIFAMYDAVSPPINMKQRQNYALYKSIPRDSRMDLFSFLFLELWKDKFEGIKLYSNKYIEESDLKSILKDFGMMDMPDPVLDLAKKGYDIMRRRIFDPRELIIDLLSVHDIANDIIRTKIRMRELKLKPNRDSSRKFLNWDRRFYSSPRV